MKPLADILAILTRQDKPPATAAELRASLDKIEVASFERACDDLEAERRRALLTASDQEIARLDERIASAERAVERAHVAREEIGRRIGEAEAAEQRAKVTAQRHEAERLTSIAVAAIETDLPAAFAAVRRVLRTIAEADLACATVNALLPADEAVQGPEDFRRTKHARPAKVTKRETVNLWWDPFNRSILSDKLQSLVRPDVDPTKGTVIPSGAGLATASPMHVVLKHFERVTRLPEVRPGGVDTLASSVVLPPIFAGEPDGWVSQLVNDAASLIKSVDEIEAHLATRPGRDDRRPEVILVPISETPAARAA